MRKAILLMLLAVVSSSAAADDYICTIDRVSGAEGDTGKKISAQRLLIGKQFTVERRTGLMAGALKNSYATKPQIIDYGSTENSYKVVTTLTQAQASGPGSNVHVRIVEEYVKTPKKPFVYLWNAELSFGYCTHF